ncbi:MAG: deoxyribonuclease [Desulfurococcales archaeon ex4484_217_2]|nr:MAG: deoxyribonuclease [Desulfurococcales archaeon ex4484_217_2]
MVYVDSHCHLYEFSIKEIMEYIKDTLIAAVSDDLESSRKTVELSRKYENIVPCVGIHPWEIGSSSITEISVIEHLIVNHGVKCLGEVGLDRKFTPETIDKQRMFFTEFLNLAKEYGLAMNIHSVNTWREVYELLLKYDIEKAVFHWYTGPLDLIDEIVSSGYYISINPAYRIQEKHRRVIDYLDLEFMVTESDGPYVYRGLKLNPLMIKDTVNYIAQVKGVDEEAVRNIVLRNFEKTFLH